MALLAGVNYDPTTAASVATSANLAMTAIDTTNLRLTFTVPANGTVMVRLRCVTHGATTTPAILLGVLEGSTIRGRGTLLAGRSAGGVATNHNVGEAQFTVTGLTPGASLTWDAAYGVEFAVASSAIKWGGPDNATTNDAFGGFQFEIWETANILPNSTGGFCATMYDPGTAALKSVASLLALTALDTTNLRHTFVVPASGSVFVVLRVMVTGSATIPCIHLGVLEGATVRARTTPIGGDHDAGNAIATSFLTWEGSAVVTGLTPGATLSWDAAYGVDIGVASQNISYGGPNDTTASNGFGGVRYEVWKA